MTTATLTQKWKLCSPNATITSYQTTPSQIHQLQSSLYEKVSAPSTSISCKKPTHNSRNTTTHLVTHKMAAPEFTRARLMWHLISQWIKNIYQKFRQRISLSFVQTIVDRLPRVAIISGTRLIMPLSQLHNVAHTIMHINLFSTQIGPNPQFN